MNGFRPKILLVAHHANPEWGSEPLIGWQRAVSLAPIVPGLSSTTAAVRTAVSLSER